MGKLTLNRSSFSLSVHPRPSLIHILSILIMTELRTVGDAEGMKTFLFCDPFGFGYRQSFLSLPREHYLLEKTFVEFIYLPNISQENKSKITYYRLKVSSLKILFFICLKCIIRFSLFNSSD